MASLVLTETEFADVRSFIEQRTGIAIADSKQYLIECRLAGLARTVGCESFSELHARLIAQPESPLADQVLDAMTTNETEWFRDPGPWALLRESLLPALLGEIEAGKRGRVRIWSAAASTGQEPYSIAIAIHEAIRESTAQVQADAFEILGTDLSPSALLAARSGRYDRFEMERGLAPELRERYFEEHDGACAVVPALRRMVRIQDRNLTLPFADLGDFDIVFCRNVLIYMSADRKRDVVKRIGARLVPGGVLVIGGAESLLDLNTAFEARHHAGSVFYERSAHPTATKS